MIEPNQLSCCKGKLCFTNLFEFHPLSKVVDKRELVDILRFTHSKIIL